jgi:hypothetical protein
MIALAANSGEPYGENPFSGTPWNFQPQAAKHTVDLLVDLHMTKVS